MGNGRPLNYMGICKEDFVTSKDRDKIYYHHKNYLLEIVAEEYMV